VAPSGPDQLPPANPSAATDSDNRNAEANPQKNRRRECAGRFGTGLGDTERPSPVKHEGKGAENPKKNTRVSSGFANTDLDLQLKKHGIHKLIVIGLIAHTCVEATVRCGAELGCDVTMVRDATTDYSDVEMHAALDGIIPNYASAIVTTNEVVDSISTL
jgi:hypothetical protein